MTTGDVDAQRSSCITPIYATSYNKQSQNGQLINEYVKKNKAVGDISGQDKSMFMQMLLLQTSTELNDFYIITINNVKTSYCTQLKYTTEVCYLMTF